MLTATNQNLRTVQEVLATSQCELLRTVRAATVAYVDVETPIPRCAPCRLIGAILFADVTADAFLTIMDSYSNVILKVRAQPGIPGTFILPTGVQCEGDLVAAISGEYAHAFVYYLPEPELP